MKIVTRFLLIVLFGQWIIACNHKASETEGNYKQVELTPSQTLTLPLGEKTPNWASDCQYYDDKRGTEYVLYYSPVTQSLYLYDLEKSQLLHKIKFETEGPNAIPDPMAVQMLSSDSILVATSYTKQLFLIDSAGKILQKHDIVNNPQLAQKWRSEPSAKFYVNNGVCVFETTPLANPQDAVIYYHTSLGATLDRRSGSSYINYAHYPKEYQTGNYWTLFHNMQRITLNGKGHIVTSYPICPTIQEMDIDGQNLTEYDAKSNYFDDQTKPMKNGMNGRDHFLRENSYGAIYYDRYRNVYYRFASQGIKDELPKPAGPIVPATFMPTSVIILDSTFTKIGETRLPQRKHFYYNSFVGRNGLYISNSNPDNPANKEEQVSFTCYTLAQQ